MKTIILASASLQRKELLQRGGIACKVVPSKAAEITQITTNCSDLVKKNALLKAREVASRVKKGIVIGADTLVYVGNNQIIGKPKDLKDAKRILKLLFSRPHWVYTGVAVIDAHTQKTVIACEKTKVFMNHLSDQEIDIYHKRISPLDKAGGFDIEGHGGLFIRRIEGCYSNVIGLPMARLRKMLKEFNINVF